jgi:hypothetical protein
MARCRLFPRILQQTAPGMSILTYRNRLSASGLATGQGRGHRRAITTLAAIIYPDDDGDWLVGGQPGSKERGIGARWPSPAPSDFRLRTAGPGLLALDSGMRTMDFSLNFCAQLLAFSF